MKTLANDLNARLLIEICMADGKILHERIKVPEKRVETVLSHFSYQYENVTAIERDYSEKGYVKLLLNDKSVKSIKCQVV